MARVNLADVPDAWDRDIRQRLAYVYLVRLDILPAPYWRKRWRCENWLGFALFLPSYLFVLWKLLSG
jgi:hypothetical protein